MSDLDQQDLQKQGMSQDVDAYINYYGFTGDPFSPEGSSFFISPQIEKLLRLFNYLARFSRKLVLVTGAKESGKTALLENFVNEQSEQEQVCFFTALEADTPRQVLVEISEQLNVPDLAGDESPEQIINAVRDYSQEQLDHDQNCMVVIDDAHLFGQEVLERLYDLTLNSAEQRCAISLLLCGESELFSQMELVVPGDVAEKTIFHQQINPLSDDEVAQYLRMHFSENAGQSKPPFSQAEYQQITEQSEGLPGRVNAAAKEVLMAGMAGLLDSAEAADKKPKSFVAVLAVILVLIGGGFFWWQSSEQLPLEDKAANQSMVGQIERSAEEAGKVQSEPMLEQQLFADPEPEVLTEEQAEQSGDPKIIENEAADVVPASVEVVEDIAEKAEVEVAETEAKVLEVAEPDAEDEAKSESIQIVEQRTVATHSLADDVVKEQVVAEAVPQEAAQVKPVTWLSKDKVRILDIPSSEYTMQLLGSQKKDSIQKVMAKLPDDNNLMVFEKTHKGAPWFVLIYGHYADRATANAAATKMPAALKGIKPWVRGVSGIQDTIKAHQ